VRGILGGYWDRYKCLTQVRVTEHGARQGWKLSLRFPRQNGGAVTRVKLTLLSTNFTEVYTSTTYYDGWTDTLVVWRSKVEQGSSRRESSGLPQTFIRTNGTRTSLKQQETLSREE